MSISLELWEVEQLRANPLPATWDGAVVVAFGQQLFDRWCLDREPWLQHGWRFVLALGEHRERPGLHETVALWHDLLQHCPVDEHAALEHLLTSSASSAPAAAAGRLGDGDVPTGAPGAAEVDEALPLLQTAAARMTGSLEQLEEADALVRDTPFRLEGARCAVALGVHLRRRGRQAAARDVLRRGAALAESCGAVPLQRVAADELAATGAKSRRAAHVGPAALTRREAKVARLAAAGLSNRDIAQSLFVTLRTVELHLTNAYRKLGIDSRARLAGALGDGEDDPEP